MAPTWRGPESRRIDLADLLDRLVSESAGAVTAVRRFPARPARDRPDSRHDRPASRGRAAGAGDRGALHAPGPRPRAARQGWPLRRGDADGLRQDALLQPAGPPGALVEPATRALYLFPTKALAQDQLAELEQLAQALPALRIHTYDGDTPQDARRAVRARANVVLTNPDMLHAGILPHHTKWLGLFQNLRYVVIDELHTYRGVFGSHLANVLRRLQRICQHYGAAPQFICTSATIANPQELAERLVGAPVGLVADSGAPAGEKVVVFYNPPVVNAELGIRRPYLKEASRLATPFLRARVPTIVFTGSRLAEEVVLTDLKAAVERAPAFTDVIRGYRGGYLPNRRREVERGLRAGDVLGVVSTNALELGIDIGRLDVAVLAGYPGTVASTWQQAGRAGRRTGLSAAVLVASSAPLDQFIVTHPDYFFGAPPEHGLINPDNPYVLVSHLKCAAFELPFADDEPFGAEDVGRYLGLLEEEGLLHRTGGRYHWTSETLPGGPPVAPERGERQLRRDRHHPPDARARRDRPAAHAEARGDRRGRLEERLRDGPSEGDLPRRGAAVRGPGAPLPRGRGEGRLRQAGPGRLLHRRGDGQGGVGARPLPDRRHGRGAAPGASSRASSWSPSRWWASRRSSSTRWRTWARARSSCPSRRCRPRGSGSRSAPRSWRRSRRTATRSSTASGAWRISSITWPRSSSCATCETSAPGSATPPRPSRASEAPRGPRVLTTERTRARLLAAERFEPTVYLYDSQPGGVGLTERLFELVPRSWRGPARRSGACPCRAGLPVVRGAGERGRPPGEAHGGGAPRSPGSAEPGDPSAVMPPDDLEPAPAPGRARIASSSWRGSARRLQRLAAAPCRPSARRPATALPLESVPTPHGPGAPPDRDVRVPAAVADGDLPRPRDACSSTPRRPASPGGPAPTCSWSGSRRGPAGRTLAVTQYFLGDLGAEAAFLHAVREAVAGGARAGHVQRAHLRPAAARDALPPRPGALVGRRRSRTGTSTPSRAPSGGGAPRIAGSRPWRRRCSGSTAATTCPARSCRSCTSATCAPQIPPASPRIFRHNRWDLVALAGLHARADALLGGPDPRHDPVEWLGAGRWLERREPDRSARFYEAALHAACPCRSSPAPPGGSAGSGGGRAARRRAPPLGGRRGARRAAAPPAPDRSREAPRAPRARLRGRPRPDAGRPRGGRGLGAGRRATSSRRSSAGRTG